MNKFIEKGYIEILILLSFILMIVFVGALFYLKKQNSLVDEYDSARSFSIQNQPAIDQTENTSINPPIQNNIPELFPEVEWGESITLTGYENNYDNSIFVTDTSNNDTFMQSYKLPGKFWKFESQNDIDVRIRYRFIDYYSDELKRLGWKSSKLAISGFEISPLIADGPMGSSLGYLQLDEGKVRTIVISELYLQDENGIEKVELSVFLSEWVEVEDLIKEENKL